MYVLNANTEITQELILKLIQRKQADNARLNKLYNYYCNKGEILRKTVTDSSKPNNIVANGYGRYIVDTLASLFSEITYNAQDVPEIKPILDYNDAENTDAVLYRNLGLYGRTVEIHYTDGDGYPRFCYVDPRDVIICLKNDLKKDEILLGIHIIQNYDYINNQTTYTVDVYDDKGITTYDAGYNCQSLTYIGEAPHFYGMVPFSYAKQDFGDFEQVVSLIDAYDQLTSESLDDYSYFVDSYLLLTGLTAEKEDIAAMKENRVILLDDAESKAEWLIKSENDQTVRNLKNDIKANIHKFSFVPDFTDEKFGNTESGISLKYKLFGCEAILNSKEKAMALLIRRRLELICQILNIKGQAVDFNSIKFEQHRNLPTNLSEIADVAQKLSNIVSTQTLLGTIPIVEDVDEEIVKLDNETQKKRDETPFIGGFQL